MKWVATKKILPLIALFACGQCLADVRLPRLFSDNMVIQRDEVNSFWGWADPSEHITVRVSGEVLETQADKQGNWLVSLPIFEAGETFDISVKGKNTLKISNVVAGDVWLASGQSNMQLPMYRVAERFPEAIGKANFPDIRQFTVPRELVFEEEKQDVPHGEWQTTTPESVAQHSAVAYFFARKLLETQKVPIGILSSNFGGSPAECWMSEDALKSYPKTYIKAKSYQVPGYVDALKKADSLYKDAWFGYVRGNDQGLKENWQSAAISKDWKTLEVPGRWAEQGVDLKAGVVWFKREINIDELPEDGDIVLRMGSIIDQDTAYINGEQVGTTGYQYPPRIYKVKPGILKKGKNLITVRVRAENNGGVFITDKPYYLQIGDQQIDLTGTWHYRVGVESTPVKGSNFVPWSQPLGCFNGMIAPLLNTKIKGVIWYQGESNVSNAGEYDTIFKHLISNWRTRFNQGEFPFIFVQLALLNEGIDRPAQKGEQSIAQVRYAQSLALSEPNTAMVSAVDVGEWNDIHPTDKKTVGERLAAAARSLAYGEDVVYSGPIFRSAKRSGKKVVVEFDHIGSGLSVDGDELLGFSLADDCGEYHWAEAEIKNNEVIVWHPKIKKPTAVRYAWADNPERANLQNKEGLPASVFEQSIK